MCVCVLQIYELKILPLIQFHAFGHLLNFLKKKKFKHNQRTCMFSSESLHKDVPGVELLFASVAVNAYTHRHTHTHH